MNTTLKYFLFILGIVILSGAVFAGGVMFGTTQNFMKHMFTVSTMDKAYMDASSAFRHIQEIDKGNIDEAKESINILLNSHILTIDSFMKDIPNDEDKARAKKLLARIARHRNDFPATINVTLKVPEYENVTNSIQNILDNALAEEK